MMHLLRKYDVAPFGRNDAMFAIMCRQAHIIRRSRHHWQSQHHLPQANIIKKRQVSFEACRFLVGAGGFGPPKSLTTDLQSAPFGRSGTLPYIEAPLCEAGAGERSRTINLLITNQLLCH